MLDRISVNEVIREALFVKWQACGGTLEEGDVLNTLNWLFETPIGRHKAYLEIYYRSLRQGIDIEKVRGDMESAYLARVSDREIAKAAVPN